MIRVLSHSTSFNNNTIAWYRSGQSTHPLGQVVDGGELFLARVHSALVTAAPDTFPTPKAYGLVRFKELPENHFRTAMSEASWQHCARRPHAAWYQHDLLLHLTLRAEWSLLYDEFREA